MIRQTIHSIQKKLHRVTAQVYNSNAPKKRLFSSSFLSRKRHEIYAWGDATHGQIGNGMPHGAVGIPSLVEELAADLRFGSIGTGQFHSMALTEQGHLYSWGRAGFQDESPDKSLTSVTPLRINGPWNDEAIVSASGGRAHTVVVSKKGKVYSWGNGHNFQLGHGDGKDQSVPKLVNALIGQQAVKISSGWGHNLILTADSKVWSWGWNQDGQLGIGSTDHSSVPRFVPGLTGVKVIDIAAGSDHSLLLTSEGTVIAFGLGEMGQLGRGNKDTSTGPVLVQFPPNVKITSIAAGFAHCLAISDKGELYTWGWNSDGQLGLDDTDDRTTPTVIPTENKTTLIACGRVNSLCYTDANLLYSWGSAQSGRLGTGSRAHQLTPDIVDELSHPELKVLALGCGLDHVLALVERE